MHEPQEQSTQVTQKEKREIDLGTAYKVLLQAYIRTQNAEQDSQETDYV